LFRVRSPEDSRDRCLSCNINDDLVVLDACDYGRIVAIGMRYDRARYLFAPDGDIAGFLETAKIVLNAGEQRRQKGSGECRTFPIAVSGSSAVSVERGFPARDHSFIGCSRRAARA